MSAEAMSRTLVSGVIEMMIDLNYLRVRLPDGEQYYVLTPDLKTNTWRVNKSLLKAINAKEVRP